MGKHSKKEKKSHKKRADDTSSEYIEYEFDPSRDSDSFDHRKHNYDYRTNGPMHKHRHGLHASKRRGVVFITGGSLLVIGGASIMWIPFINVVAGVPLMAAGVIAITAGSIDVSRKKHELKWREKNARPHAIQPAAGQHRVDRSYSNPVDVIQEEKHVELAPKGEGNQGQGWQRQEDHQYKPPLQYAPKPGDPYIPGREDDYKWGSPPRARSEERHRYDDRHNLLTDEMKEEGRGDAHPEPTANYREAMINPEADRAMDPTHPHHDNNVPVRGKHDVDLAKEEVTKDDLFHAHSYGDHRQYHHHHHHHEPASDSYDSYNRDDSDKNYVKDNLGQHNTANQHTGGIRYRDQPSY